MTIPTKTAFFRLAAVFFAAICFLQISAQADPPDYKKMSEDEIQKILLKDVPLGSSSDEVRAYLKKKTGKDPGIETNISIPVKNPVAGADGSLVEKHFDRVTVAVVDTYGFAFFYTEVVTYWEFDSHFRLIKLTVSKQGGDMP